jgi:hypothetical protein
MLRDARNSSLLRLDKRSGRAAARARSPAAAGDAVGPGAVPRLLIFGDSAPRARSLGLVGVQLHGERPIAMQAVAERRRARSTECASRGLNVG